VGRLLLSRGNFQQAVVCFDRANLLLLRDISQCYHLRKQARLLEAGNTQRKAAFLGAGNRFSQCGIGKHDQSQQCYLRAGECYVEAGKDMEAFDAFRKAKELTKGTQDALSEGGNRSSTMKAWRNSSGRSTKAANFDQAGEIVQSHLAEESVALGSGLWAGVRGGRPSTHAKLYLPPYE